MTEEEAVAEAEFKLRAEAFRKTALVVARHFWKAINSSIVLLILSGVVLAQVSNDYAQDKETAQFKAARRIELVALHSEIALRDAELSEIAEALRGPVQPSDAERAFLAQRASAVVRGLPPFTPTAKDYAEARLESLIERYEVTAGLDLTSQVRSGLDVIARGGEPALAALSQPRPLSRWVLFMAYEFSLDQLPISLVHRGRRTEVLCDYREFQQDANADDQFLRDRIQARKKHDKRQPKCAEDVTLARQS